MPSVLIFAIYVLKSWKLSATPPKWLRDPLGGRDPPVGNRWALDAHWEYNPLAVQVNWLTQIVVHSLV